MLKFKSISVRIMVAISAVAAVCCAMLGGLGMWQQQATVNTALQRESQADYANLSAAIEAETRTALAVAHSLAAVPQLAEIIRSGDREATLAQLEGPLKAIVPLGIELITIQTPPSIVFVRAHAPKVFGDDIGARRKMVVEALATKKPLAGVEVGREVLNIFGTVPLMAGDQQVGVIDVGQPFGDKFVKNMKARFGADVAIYQLDGDAVKTLASTVGNGSYAPDAASAKRVMGGEVLTLQMATNDRPVLDTLGAIKSFSGQPVAIVQIVRDASAYAALKSQSATWLLLTTIGGLTLACLLSIWMGRGLARPVRALEAAMRAIASGREDVVVPGLKRGDEIGSMAGAVEVFKENLVETGRLRGAQEEQRIAAENERRATLHALAQRFEESVGHVVSSVGNASTELRSTAESMAGSAETATQQTNVVADISAEVSRNSQAVAAAIEEMNASVSEIAQQVHESAKVTGEAVNQATNTNAGMRELASAAQRIGDVVKLISEIAAQTNLLALNATIEAARAGDAGRGFAVVASEVKELATQTSKATDEISAQVAAIQAATRESAAAIDEITHTIGRVNEIASAIASAVEEQGAATAEIARNVAQAAEGTSEVSGNIVAVRDAATKTGSSAALVVEAAAALSESGSALKQQVESFLNEVRAA